MEPDEHLKKEKNRKKKEIFVVVFGADEGRLTSANQQLSSWSFQQLVGLYAERYFHVLTKAVGMRE